MDQARGEGEEKAERAEMRRSETDEENWAGTQVASPWRGSGERLQGGVVSGASDGDGDVRGEKATD